MNRRATRRIHASSSSTPTNLNSTTSSGSGTRVVDNVGHEQVVEVVLDQVDDLGPVALDARRAQLPALDPHLLASRRRAAAPVASPGRGCPQAEFVHSPPEWYLPAPAAAAAARRPR